MMYGSNMGAGGWAFSIFATLIIIGLILATAIWFALSRRPDRRAGDGPTLASAREILDRRLASDEITADQYDQLREKLDARPASSTR
jgi:uncharacterized membrane protein